jgi:hypothetical protein
VRALQRLQSTHIRFRLMFSFEGSHLLEVGGVAQLGEHLPCKQGVRSSILLVSTNFRAYSSAG